MFKKAILTSRVEVSPNGTLSLLNRGCYCVKKKLGIVSILWISTFCYVRHPLTRPSLKSFSCVYIIYTKIFECSCRYKLLWWVCKWSLKGFTMLKVYILSKCELIYIYSICMYPADCNKVMRAYISH